MVKETGWLPCKHLQVAANALFQATLQSHRPSAGTRSRLLDKAPSKAPSNATSKALSKAPCRHKTLSMPPSLPATYPQRFSAMTSSI